MDSHIGFIAKEAWKTIGSLSFVSKYITSAMLWKSDETKTIALKGRQEGFDYHVLALTEFINIYTSEDSFYISYEQKITTIADVQMMFFFSSTNYDIHI